MPVKMIEINMEDVLRGDVPPELRGMIEQMFQGAAAEQKEYEDPRVQRLKKMTVDGLMAQKADSPGDLVTEFGFDEKDMAHWSLEIGHNIAAQKLAKDGGTVIDVGSYASVAYLMGVLQGVALERGCDGESCEHCSHMRGSARQ